MKNKSPHSLRFLSIVVTVLMILSILLTSTPAAGATQYLGGYSRENDLKIQVQDDGRIGVERWTGSAWERQIYAVSNKGSRLQYSGGSVGLGYFSGGSKTMNENSVTSSGSAGSRTWVGNAKWTGSDGKFTIQQTITYREGDPYFKLQWQISNISGGAISDLRFFHGEDTYLRGGDNGAGWVDWDNKTIGVLKPVSGSEQRMALQGITEPVAYQSNNYYQVVQSVNAGSLNGTVDGNVSTDNGYALQWNNSSLGAGGTWSIIAYEKFNNVSVGAVQVIAPVAEDCQKGSTCSLLFTVKNPGSSSVNVNLSVGTNGSWPYSVAYPGGSTSATIAAKSSVQVTVSVTVPSDAANGSSMNVTLTATPSTGSAVSETGAVNAITPPNAAPTAVYLDGSTAAKTFSENNGANQSMGTLGGTDPNGDALSFSLVGGDTSYFNLNGNVLRNNSSFNYESKSSYSITVRASDGKGGTLDQAFTINVSNVNEAPTLVQPGAQTTNEDTQLSFNMTATDPDGLTSRLNWSVLQAPASGSLSGISGTGGSKTAFYTPNLNFNGSDSFQVRVTGEGGTTSDQTVAITINAVNDAPLNYWNAGTTYGGPIKLRVNQSITFDEGSATHIPNFIHVDDVDVASSNLLASLSVSKGALTLGSTAGVSGDTNGADGSLSIQGTLANVNNALKGLTYTPNNGYSGSDTLTITSNDQGATGSGGTKTDTDAVNFTISNPTTFIVDDNYTGSATGDWGYDHFTTLADAMAAAQQADSTNGDPKPGLTIKVNEGSYASDGVALNNSRITLQLDGDVSLGKDFSLTSGVFNANGKTVTFITGPDSQTNHVVSGAPDFANLAVANGNMVSLADGANPGLTGSLTLTGSGALDATPESGRATLTLKGAGAQSLPSGLTLDNLVVSNGTTFNAPAALTLQGSLTNNGTYAGGTGTITFAGTQEQQISGTAPQFGGVSIASGAMVKPGTEIKVSGNWSDAGDFRANGQTVTFNGTAAQSFSGETVFSDVAVAAGAQVNLASGADFGYNDTFTLDGAFDAATAANTTVRLAGSSAQTLPAALNNLDHLAINAGASLDATDRDLSLLGDLTVNGTLTNTSGSVSFNGANPTSHALHVADGASVQFGDLNLAAGNSLTPDEGKGIKVNGNWNDQGTFNANGGTVTFNGAAQSFSGETVFSNVAIQSSSTLTLGNNADFGYTGAFTQGGTFDPLTNANTTVRLAGTSVQTLPSNVNELNHLVINAGSSLNAVDRDLTLRGDLNNLGSLDNTGGSITFGNGNTHTFTTGDSTVLSQFGSLNIAGSNTLSSACTSARPMKISGDWNKAGTYTANQCEAIFNGSDAQNILGAGNTFYKLTIQNTAAYPNDEKDVDSESPVTVTDTLLVKKGQFQPEDNSTFASVILGGDQADEAGILRPDRGERLLVNGNWQRKANGWFDANAGTVEFNSANHSLIEGGATFYDLLVNKDSQSLESSSPVVVDHQLTVASGKFNPSANSKFKNVLVQTGSELKPVGNINISGNLTNQGTYTHNSKSVTFDGSDVQALTGRWEFYNLTVNSGSKVEMQQDSVLGYAGALLLQGSLDATTHPHNTVEVMGNGFVQSLPAVTVNDLKIRSTSSLKLTGNLTVTGNMQVESAGAPAVFGGFDPNGKKVTFSRLTGSDDPTFSGTATFGAVDIAGNSTLTLKDGANFKFTGDMTGLTGEPNSGRLNAADTGTNTTVTAAGISGAQHLPLGTVVDNLVIQNGAQLSGDGNTIHVNGDWTHQGTGSFAAGSGTISFEGSAAETISGSGQNFNQIVVNKTDDSLLTAGVVTTTGIVEMQAGKFKPACGSTFYEVSLSGGELLLPDEDNCQISVTTDWTQATAGTFTANGATVLFDGPDAATHTIYGDGATLDGLKIASGESLVLGNGANLKLAGPLDGTGATFTGNDGSTLTVTGAVTLPQDMTLDNLVIASSGALTMPHVLTLTGDFTNQGGTFNNLGGGVVFPSTPSAAHTLVTGASGTQFGSLTINDGATLNLGSGTESTDSISVAGDWTNLGTFTSNKGTVVLDGTSNQNIRTDGTNNNFYNLTIDNTTTPAPGVVASQNADGSAAKPISITNDLTVLHGKLLVPAGSDLTNVHVGPNGVIDLPADGNSVSVDGIWDNQGTITTGGGSSIQQVAPTFYLQSAVVDKNFSDSEPGLGFDKFKTIAEGLSAARDVIYIRGGADTPTDYAAALGINSGSTTAKAVIEGKVKVTDISLTSGEISLANGAVLQGDTYAQTGGTFNTGTGTLTLAGNFAPTAGTFNGGTGTLALTGDFAPTSGVFAAQTGTVEFNGSAAQLITPPAADFSFNNLTINNSAATPADDAAVTAAGAYIVNGALDVQDGQFMPPDESHFFTMHIGDNGVLKLASAADVYVDTHGETRGSLTRDASGQLYLNGGIIHGLPQSSVDVDDSWTTATSGFGYDRFNDIQAALDAVPDMGTANVLDGTYAGMTVIAPARTVKVNGTVVFNSGLTVTKGSLEIANGKTLQLPGDFSVDATAAFVANQGAVEMTGLDNQVIFGSGLSFYDLTIHNTGTSPVSTVASIAATNDLKVESGVFEPACGSSFKNVTISNGAELRMPAIADCAISVSGTWTVQTGGTFTPNDGKVTFTGANAAISGAATFASIEIASGATLTAPADTLTLTGNWTNGGTFAPNGGTVAFTGSGTHVLSAPGDAVLNFNDLTIGDGSTLQPDENLSITDDLSIGSGSTLQPGGNITLGGDWTQAETGVFTPAGHTVTFSGDQLQTVTGPAAGITFDNMAVDKTGSKVVFNPMMTVTQSLDIARGELELHQDSYVHNTENTATGHLGASATLTLVDKALNTGISLNVDNWSSDGGTIAANSGRLIPGKITAMVVDDDFTAETTPGFGIDRFNSINTALGKTYLADNATITVNDGTYAEGVNITKPVHVVADTGSSISLNSLTINHASATFTAPTTLTLTGNLTVTSGSFDANQGTVVLAGSGIEHELTSGLVLNNLEVSSDSTLTGPAALTLKGNFSNQGNDNAFNTSLTLTGTGNHTFSGVTAFKDINVSAGNTLTLDADAADALALYGTLTLADGPAALTAPATSTLILVDPANTLPTGLTLGNLKIAPGNTFTAPAALTLAGSFENQGEFNANDGTVTFTGSGVQNISGYPTTFYNLTIDDADDTTGANDTRAAVAVNVSNVLNVYDGKFSPSVCSQYGSLSIGANGVFAPATDSTCSVQVSGDWTNNGSFTAGTSKISLNGSAAQLIGGLNDTIFNNLEIANTSATDRVSAAEGRSLQVDGALTVSDGAFKMPAGAQVKDVSIAADGTLSAPLATWTVTGNWTDAGTYQANSGNVRFSGGAAHAISGSTPFAGLEAADGDTLALASGARPEVNGALNFNTSGAVTGEANSTLRLTGSGPVTLPDASVIGGLEIGSQVIFNAPANLTLKGGLNNQGSFNPQTGAVTFSGSADKTLTGNVPFNNLTIDGGTLTMAQDAVLTLGGTFSLANSGTLNGSADGAKVIAAGSGTQTLPGNLNLHDLQVAEGATLSVGGSLTLYGDLDVLGAYNNGAGSTTFDGPNGTIHYLTGAGAVIFGNLTIAAGNTLVMPDGKEISVKGNWTNNGTFTPNGGTVTFNGAGDQTIGGTTTPANFANLKVDKASGTLTGTNPVAVSGTLDVTQGEFDPAAGSTFADVNIQTSGILNAPNGTLSVSGDWSNAGTFNGNNGTVDFTGTGDQQFSGATTFNNIQIGAGSNLVLGENANLGYAGTFTIANGGSLDATTNANTTVTVAGDGTPEQTLPNGLTLDNLTVATGAILDGTDTAVTLEGNLTVDGQMHDLDVTFGGTGAQQVSGTGEVHFGDVVIGPESTVTPVPSDRSIYVEGNWTNHNTGASPADGFAEGTGTVVFEGAGTHVIGGEGGTTFNNLEVAGGTLTGPASVTQNTTVDSGATFQPANGSHLNNLINNGTVTPEDGGTISVSGNWTNNGTFDPNHGTVVLSGTGDQTIGGSTTPANFNNLVISGAGTVTSTDPLSVSGDLRLEDGGGTLVVPDGSVLTNVVINPNSTLQLANNAHFTLNGTWSNSGTYDANGGGLAEGSHPQIESAIVDPACALPENASACGVDRFATIQAAIDAVAVDGVVTVLPGTYGTSGTDTMVMPSVDVKPIRMVFQGSASDTFTIQGNVVQNGGTIIAPSGTLTLGGNLTRSGGAFNANGGKVVFNGGAQTISGLETSFYDLELNDAGAGSNTLDGQAVVNVNHLLNVADGAFSPTQCGQYASIEIGAAGVFAPASDAACVNVSGNWTNSGSFTANGATVTLNGAAAQTLGGGADTTFANLVISNTSDAGAVSMADSRKVTVTGTTNVQDGKFEPSDQSSFNTLQIGADGTFKPATGASISLSGNATNQGAFTANGGKVVLTGGSDQSFTGNFGFYDLQINKDPKTAKADFNGGLAVANQLDLTSGELQFASGADFKNLSVAADGTLAPDANASFSISGNWTNLGTYTPNQDTVVFDGSGAQNISGISSLYNLTVSNTATPPEHACDTTASCNAFYDANSVNFNVPLTIANQVLVTDGQYFPLAGSTFKDVTIGAEGRVRGQHDTDSNTSNDFIAVTGRLNNSGLFDLNGLGAQGDFAIDHAYISSQYTSDATPGFGVDHFNTIQAALAAPGLRDDSTVTLYGGTYITTTATPSYDLVIDKALKFDVQAKSALDQSSMPVVLQGNLTLNNTNAVWTAPAGEMQISGNLKLQAGQFDANGGKVTFNGSSEQHIQGTFSFYDLTINNSAATPGDDADVDVNTALRVTHTLNVHDGQFSPMPCSSFASVVIDADGILKPQASVAGTCESGLSISGDWTNNGGSFTPNGSLVTFNGTTAQTITGEQGFGDLTIDNPAGVTAVAPFKSSGLLTIKQGNLTLPDGAAVEDVKILSGGSLSMAAGGTLTVTGDWEDQNAHGGFNANGSTVKFDGNGTQTFTGTSTFHNVEVGSNSDLVLAEGANLGYSGAFTLDSGGTLDATTHNTTITIAHTSDSPVPQHLPGPGDLTLDNLVIDSGSVVNGDGQNLTLLGNLTNNGTFNGGTGSVTFDGPEGTTQHIGGTGDTNFSNLTISNAVNGDSPVDVTGTLTVASGGTFAPADESRFDDVTISNGGVLDGSNGDLHVTGNWNNQGSFIPGTGSVIFEGPDDQTLSGSTTFNDLTVNKDTSTGKVTVNDPITVTDTLDVAEGEFVQVQNGSTFDTIKTEPGGTITTIDGANDISVNHLDLEPGSFQAPNGVFKPSNILWADDQKNFTLLAEKPAGLDAGVLYSVDLNLEAQNQFAYSLVDSTLCSSNDNAFFTLAVNPADGLTHVTTSKPLDFETRSEQPYVLCLKTTDPTSLHNIKMVYVTPTDANDEPVIAEDAADGQADGVVTKTIDEDAPLSLTLNASDQDRNEQGEQKDTLTWSVATQPQHGSLTLPATLTGNSLALEYHTSQSDWNGQDTFTVRASDGNGGITDLLVRVSVQARNDPPVNVTAPVILSGDRAGIGQKVQVSSGEWNDNHDPEAPGSVTITYQWQRSGTSPSPDAAADQNVEDITNATESAYYPTAADQGKYIRANVTAHDSGSGTPATSSTSVSSGWVFVPGNAPIDIQLSHQSIAEKQPVDTLVANISAVDADAGDAFTYQLVEGVGSEDNAQFTVDGYLLKTAAVFDITQKASYSIRLRVTDGGGNTFERAFTITVVGTQTEVQPKSGGLIVIPGTAQNPGGTTIQVPVGAVLDPVLLIFTPTDVPEDLPVQLSSNNAFNLSAMINGEDVKGYEFNKPVNFTLSYPEDPNRNVNENTMKLMMKTDQGWVDAACGDVVRDTANNTITVPVCKIGDFALVGSIQYWIYSPLISR